VVMPDQITHKAIEDILIQLNHAIPTVNIAMPHTLHNRECGVMLRLSVSEDHQDATRNRHRHHSST
jgi:hypothetical protein